MIETKSVPVTKRMVWEAYKKVRSNNGSAGIDEQTFEKFEEKLADNLYVLWNRMASGSYFPLSVKVVQIPKKNGKTRDLGIPTIADRTAQQVVKNYLEQRYEAIFYNQSQGYRPGRNAHQAITNCLKNCYDYAWVIDIDIKGFFDNLDHEQLMEMLDEQVSEKWAKRYIKRWLEAPAEKDGNVTARSKGTPQGGVISPLLANVYLHYAFDQWMDLERKHLAFERYADDIIVHCLTLSGAQRMLNKIIERLKQFGLEINEEKTKIVYCKQRGRKENYDTVSFTFLGYDFKPRLRITKDGERFLGYGAGISRQSKKSITQMLRKLGIKRWTNATIEQIAGQLNAKIRGWIQYYGLVNKSEMHPVFLSLNIRLLQWWRNKFKVGSYEKARLSLVAIQKENPSLFAHWKEGFTDMVYKDTVRMTRAV